MNVTDEPMPGEAGSPEQAPIPEAEALQPTPEPPASGAAAARPGRGRTIIVIGLIVAFLAIVLFVVRNNVSADDLAVGDCFNLPNGSTIKTVEKHPCNESHNAEVIFVGEYTGATYPISLSLDSYIEDSCLPAFESYVGRAIDSQPELSLGYFHPTQDGWDSGDRTISCYISQPDESPMTESLKAS
jgi:Septum formation